MEHYSPVRESCCVYAGYANGNRSRVVREVTVIQQSLNPDIFRLAMYFVAAPNLVDL
jgi:hypothetical protein